MKRHLVVTSSTIIRPGSHTELDAAVELAAAGERARLQAYLYGNSTLVAVAHDVQAGSGHRLTQRALVVVEHDDAARCRYLADYQTGRLQSGSFGVEDYVEDERQARLFVLGDEAFAPEPTLAEALEYAVSALDSEAVLGSLGLDSDTDISFMTITVDGIERPYTEADQAAEIARHNKIVELLRDALKRETYVPNHGGDRPAQNGADVCRCGCKYWQDNRCIDCGTSVFDPSVDRF